MIVEEPRLVALWAEHPLADRNSLRYRELRDERFIVNPMLSGEHAIARWRDEQHRHGLPGRIAGASTGVLEILTLVAAARGICLLPSAVPRYYPRDDIVYVPVDDADRAVVSLARLCPGLLSAWPRCLTRSRRSTSSPRQTITRALRRTPWQPLSAPTR